VIADSGLPDVLPVGAVQHPVEELPDDVLVFCSAAAIATRDRLHTLAWSLFGGIAPGWPRVEAILQYAHDRISFGYEHARSDRTAAEAHEERRGVCRDYAHLAIALCRCMNIPARYCTGYLGDIGVPVDVNPMDFSAWLEVYLGGAWHVVDAAPRSPAHRAHYHGAWPRRHRCRHQHRLRQGRTGGVHGDHGRSGRGIGRICLRGLIPWYQGRDQGTKFFRLREIAGKPSATGVSVIPAFALCHPRRAAKRRGKRLSLVSSGLPCFFVS
jgi:hypothetical protein